jgi:hypothetical protein
MLIKFLCLLFAVLIFRTELSAQTAAIKILPVSQTIGIDSIASVNVKLDDIQQLHAYSIEISYDPSLLKYQSITRMDFLSGWQTFFFPFIDTINGRIKADEAILGPYVQSGSGEIFKIIFKGKVEGNCSLFVTVSELRNLDNQNISATINNAVVQIGFPLSALNEQGDNYSKHELQIFPNPFNSIATIELTSGTDEIKSIKIFNCNGEQVYDYNISSLDIIHRVNWNGKNLNGNSLTSGVYLVVAETSADFLVKKIMMLK